jgi:hypothetical protein
MVHLEVFPGRDKMTYPDSRQMGTGIQKRSYYQDRDGGENDRVKQIQKEEFLSGMLMRVRILCTGPGFCKRVGM